MMIKEMYPSLLSFIPSFPHIAKEYKCLILQLSGFCEGGGILC